MVDADFRREWLLPEPLQYFVVKDKQSGLWSICDRNTDLMVSDTEARTREQAIRKFYKLFNRPVPVGESLAKVKGVAVANQGETG